MMVSLDITLDLPCRSSNLYSVSLPAGVMVWLASPEAGFLKGKYIWANWDIDEMKARADEIADSDLLTMKLGGWPFPYKSA